jgi:CheY-like chemotaxis protein
MPETKASLLIADDDPFIRILLSKLFAEEGYRVRSAADTSSALAEIRRQIPEFLLSDLDMAGMSGFELFEIVRSEFPEIRVILMSNAHSEYEGSCSASADGFFRKGTGFGVLLGIMESLPCPERVAQQTRAAPLPVWVPRCLRNSAGESYVTIECPECGGSFPKVLKGTVNPANETNCLHCGSPIRYAVVPPDDRPAFHTFLLPLQRRHSALVPALQSIPKFGS